MGALFAAKSPFPSTKRMPLQTEFDLQQRPFILCHLYIMLKPVLQSKL